MDEKLTPQRAREVYRQMTVDKVTSDKQVPVGGVEDRTIKTTTCRIYRPDAGSSVPTLVYFHGGGFVVGDLDTHDHACRILCRLGEVVVVAVNYRLAPEDPFPAAVEDAVVVTRWVAGNLANLGGRAKLAVAGDSAGGTLAAVVAQQLRDRIDAQILIYPATGGTDVTGSEGKGSASGDGHTLNSSMIHWFADQYAGHNADGKDPRLSPVNGNLVAVPRALVCTAELDLLRKQGETYADRLREAGVHVETVCYPALPHGFVATSASNQTADDAVQDIARRIHELTR